MISGPTITLEGDANVHRIRILVCMQKNSQANIRIALLRAALDTTPSRNT